MSEADDLYRLIYLSRAREGLGIEDIENILDVSRPRNEELGITGLLLFEEGRFMQVLEGSKQSVTRVFERIREDNRHTNVIVILEHAAEEREFHRWSMAFHEIGTADVELKDGFSRIVSGRGAANGIREDLEFIRQYLGAFKRMLDVMP